MAETQFDREDVRMVLSLVSARKNMIAMLRGEFPNYAPNPQYFDRDVRQFKEDNIEHYTELLKGYLKKMQGTSEILTPELRDNIIQDHKFYLDFHPTATYPEDPLTGKKYTDIFNEHRKRYRKKDNLTPEIENAFLAIRDKYAKFNPDATYPGNFIQGEPLVYLGHIAEKRPENIDEKPHLFLITRSNEQRQPGVSYPENLQQEEVQSYTNKDVTWVDTRKPFQHLTSDELCELIRLKLDGYIPHRGENVLSKLRLEQLAQLREEGIRNYQGLRRRVGLDHVLN